MLASPAPPRRPRAELVEDDASRTDPRMAAQGDPEQTNPRLIMPLPAPATSSPELKLPDKPWARGLAARIDRVLDHDDFDGETPVLPPTAAELRALLGVPDTTRKQSLDELERLHAAASAKDSQPDMLAEPPPPTRRHNTTGVRDSDIEAAIELVPPARRTAIGVAKKKPEE
jgi:hypothetical protein